jgi:hypothetical protein
MPNVYELTRDHVSLSIGCIDRLYLNGYVPALQTPGQLVSYMTRHLGKPLASPALLRPIHDRFIAEVEAFAKRFQVPMISFERGQRKDDVVNRWRARYRGREGVVVIGVAQERAWSFRASKRQDGGHVSFDFSRQPVYVKHYYFYVQDRVWGPGFVKVGTYLPYPVKVCLNGHEWAKQRLRERRIRFEALDNGFLACSDAPQLQQICDSLAPSDLTGFFDRWRDRLPWPLTAADSAAGYAHRLALWQMEVSLTQVFDRPVQGRHFFEEVIRENLDLGRPDRVSLIFSKPVTRRTPPPPFGYRTRVITDGVEPSIHVEFKRSHVKQYFKEGRALRTETTINDTRDFGATKDVKNLPFLRTVGDQANRRLMEIERVSQNCTLTQDTLDRLQHPTVENGHRASALRFGDIRVMALFQALCTFDFAPQGFRHRDLRPRMAALLGLSLAQYRPGRMTYDLRRLRLKRLITRVPGTNRYLPTTHGLKVALFTSKLYLRILRPNWPALDDAPDSPPRPLRTALDALELVVAEIAENAQLRPAS